MCLLRAGTCGIRMRTDGLVPLLPALLPCYVKRRQCLGMREFPLQGFAFAARHAVPLHTVPPHTIWGQALCLGMSPGGQGGRHTHTSMEGLPQVPVCSDSGDMPFAHTCLTCLCSRRERLHACMSMVAYQLVCSLSPLLLLNYWLPAFMSLPGHSPQFLISLSHYHIILSLSSLLSIYTFSMMIMEDIWTVVRKQNTTFYFFSCFAFSCCACYYPSSMILYNT